MKTAITASLTLLALCGCSSFHAQPTEADMPEAYVQQRVEQVAKTLIEDGQAADMDEARPMAEELVKKEIEAQDYATRVNEDQARSYGNPDERFEGE